AQGAAQQAILPLRKQVSLVESESGRREGRVPVIDRLLHPVFARVTVTDPYSVGAGRIDGSGVIDSIINHGPAVIRAFLDNIDFVAAFRTDVGAPQLSRFRIERKSFRVA